MDDALQPEDLNPAQRFGIEVREVRIGRKLTQKQLGRATGYSEGYVSKVESGNIVASMKFARGCDLTFGTHGVFVRMLRRMEEGGHPNWFVPYLNLERRATQILDFSPISIIGMLQTEAYARAILRAGQPRETDDIIKEKVKTRLRRRELLLRDKPPLLWVVLHEACLMAHIGGRAAMAEQLDHLLVCARSQPNVVLQLAPFAAGAAVSHMPPHTLLRFEADPPVLYTDEVPYGGRIIRTDSTVAVALENYDRLRASAMAPDESLARIQALKEEFLT